MASAHGFGGGGEEVPPAIPPPIWPDADQTDISLVDQGGGLEGLAGILRGQPRGGELAQLVVDQR